MSDTLAIAPARNEADFAEVRRLCDGFRAWLLERYGAEVIDLVYPSEAWPALLADLPNLHAPPLGDVLLARDATGVLGVVMLAPFAAPAICEMKRLFVSDAGRGRGVGRALCLAVMELARARGYGEMRLEAGIWHEQAIPLYRSLGFAEIPAYHEREAFLAAHQMIFGIQL